MTTVTKSSIYDEWRNLELTLADEVMNNPSTRAEVYKSEFTNIVVNILGNSHCIYARTLTGRRLELSVADAEREEVNKFATRLNKLKSKTKGAIKYYLGYEKDQRVKGAPHLRYIRAEFAGQVRERIL